MFCFIVSLYNFNWFLQKTLTFIYCFYKVELWLCYFSLLFFNFIQLQPIKKLWVESFKGNSLGDLWKKVSSENEFEADLDFNKAFTVNNEREIIETPMSFPLHLVKPPGMVMIWFLLHRLAVPSSTKVNAFDLLMKKKLYEPEKIVEITSKGSL